MIAGVVRRGEVEQHTGAVLQREPNMALGYDDLIEPCNVRMYKLAVMVYLSCKIRVLLLGRFEDDLDWPSDMVSTLATVLSYLGPIRQVMRCQVNFAKGAFSYKPSKSIVSDCPEILGGEFASSIGQHRI